MKKLLTILIPSLFILNSAPADENGELLQLAEISKEADVYSDYCGLRLQQMEFSAPLQRSRLADCNTFIWYLWNDVDEAKGNIGKFNATEPIYNLTQPKPARATLPAKD